MTERASNRSRRYNNKGGRGKQGNRRSSNNNYNSSKKKTLTDYNFYVGTSQQASNYETASDFIINHIKKTYEYGAHIAQALKRTTEFDLTKLEPELKESKSEDTTIIAKEEKQYELQYKSEYDQFIKKKISTKPTKSKRTHYYGSNAPKE